MKHKLAKELLTSELQKLGGIVFQRYMIFYFKQHSDALDDEAKKELETIDSMQFFESLMSGNFPDKDAAFNVENCEEYKKMLEIAQSLAVLSTPTTKEAE